jgi:NAD(P)-dependent dehydrogenase (short-subunit alcohol dehydrogenase family)
MDLKVLSGKRCLVTGASRGLGRAIAQALLGSNARIFLTANTESSVKAVAESWGVPWIAADLSDASAVDRLAERATDMFGGIDVLVNAAGVFPVAAVSASTVAEFNQCMAVNVRAPYQLSKKLLPAMIAQSWGRIVNVGSSSAYSGFKNTAIYCASKHALLGLSRSMNDEVRAFNVRVSCFSPGSIQTDMGRKVMGQDYSTFLSPIETAQFIVSAIAFDGPMIVDEVRMNRMIVQ